VGLAGGFWLGDIQRGEVRLNVRPKWGSGDMKVTVVRVFYSYSYTRQLCY